LELFGALWSSLELFGALWGSPKAGLILVRGAKDVEPLTRSETLHEILPCAEYRSFLPSRRYVDSLRSKQQSDPTSVGVVLSVRRAA